MARKETRKIRVAVIGGGAIAQRRHLPEYFENANAQIIGVYDMDTARCADLAEDYDCKAYTSVDEILADETVEAVSVCTPNVTHSDITIRALKAGKHVLCEKPMALSLEETRAMLKAEEESGKILMLGHNQRLIPAHMKARELIRNGTIGKPLFFQSNFKHSGPENWSITNNASTWFFKKSQTTFGVMGDLGAHKIDLIRFLTDSEIDRVFADMMTLDKRDENDNLIELEDNVVCQFRLSNGMPGIMHFSWTNYGLEDNSTIIYGEKGVMKIFGDYADDIVIEMRDGTLVKYHIGGIATNTKQTKSGVIDEFIDSILKGREPIVRGLDGHYTLAVIDAAFRSQAEGRWVNIEY